MSAASLERGGTVWGLSPYNNRRIRKIRYLRNVILEGRERGRSGRKGIEVESQYHSRNDRICIMRTSHYSLFGSFKKTL